VEDQDLIQQIDALIDEEHRLRQRHPDGLSADEQGHLRHLETHLDQCWDLLRQRRARREAGQPDQYTQVRPEATVEHYQQ
jgi:hypothetical protein